jgi:ABC-2 type transport system permease protein
VNALPMLIRREFWEHRALWIAPLVVAVILLLIVIRGHGIVHLPDEAAAATFNDNQRLAIFALTHWGMTVPQYLVMVIVLFFYLIDSLYAERKDRSILFWKSLPVSDAATVTSKLLVALIVVPLGVYLLALLSDLVFSGVFRVRAGDSLLSQAVLAWDAGVWLRVHGLMFAGVLLGVLWYAPIAAYLLVLSAWARRNVFLWAVLPPVLLLIAEEMAFNTDYVKNFIAYRLGGIWYEVGVRSGIDRLELSLKDEDAPTVQQLLEAIDPTTAFTSVNLWLGLAAAIALVWAAIRIRRYRDDT